jgi:hypothetical protein
MTDDYAPDCTDRPAPERHWTARYWPNPRITIREQQAARASVPDAAGDPYEDRNAWFWPTTDGLVAAVTKITGSVHISTQPFGTLRDAAADFTVYWPAGLFWEDQGARDWMDYLARKYASGDEPRYRPPPAPRHPAELPATNGQAPAPTL